MAEKHVKKGVIKKLREKKEELGKNPSKKDVSNSLVYATRKHFGSWNAAKEEAGLKTFSKGPPRDRNNTKYSSGKGKRMKMVKLSIKISNLTDPDEIELLARKLARLEEVNVGEQPGDIPPSNLVDWAESEARSILKQHPGYYLHVQDGWAERTYKKMKGKEELEPDTQSSRPDSTPEVKT